MSEDVDSKREILILNCDEIKCCLVLSFVLKELCQAFADNGHIVREVTNISDLHDNSIVFMSCEFYVSNPVELLNRSAPNAIYIGWYWHDVDVSALKYFIYTYENLLNPPTWRKPKFDIMQRGENHCPLLLRASDHPDKIGNYEREVRLDYCYMGWGYKQNWIPSSKFCGLYHGVCNHEKFLDYNTRRQIYLSSKFALGFQCDENITGHHVSQRIYEGLAYGCVVFSESPAACEQTDNIVVFIDSKTDLESKMEYYSNNLDKFKEKQQQGYDFVKKCGTNHYAISKFVDVIENVFNIIIK
jgi:hypothetical protein